MIALLTAALITAGDPYLIESIAIEGNERVKPRIVLQELPFDVGDSVDLRTIERGRKAILDLGLFEEASYRIEPGTDGTILTYIVDEKYLWFAVPRLDRNGDGDVTYGAAAKIYNLGGLNQTLEIDVTRTQLEEADIDEEREAELVWRYPRMLGGPYELIVEAAYLDAQLEETRGTLAGSYERELESATVGISRWLHLRGPSRGWRAGASLRYDRFRHSFLAGDPTLFRDATVTTLDAFLQLDDVQDNVISREGREWLYRVTIPDRDGTLRQQLTFRRYLPLAWREHANLNYQLRVAHAAGTIFGDPAYGLGGSDSLRGFDRDSSEGDAFILANLEWLVPFRAERPRLRGALLLDVGNAYPGVDEIDLLELRVGAGIGLRWRITKLVDVELSLDLVQGLNENGETKGYAGTRATF